MQATSTQGTRFHKPPPPILLLSISLFISISPSLHAFLQRRATHRVVANNGREFEQEGVKAVVEEGNRPWPTEEPAQGTQSTARALVWYNKSQDNQHRVDVIGRATKRCSNLLEKVRNQALVVTVHNRVEVVLVQSNQSHVRGQINRALWSQSFGTSRNELVVVLRVQCMHSNPSLAHAGSCKLVKAPYLTKARDTAHHIELVQSQGKERNAFVFVFSTVCFACALRAAFITHTPIGCRAVRVAVVFIV